MSDARIAKLAGILDSIGWQSASDAPSAEVAREIEQLLGAALGAGWDAVALRSRVAESLRSHAHPLDGSSSPVAAWMPTAAELIRRVNE